MVSPVTEPPHAKHALQDQFYFAHFKGGARFSLLGVALAAEIEDRANHYIQAVTGDKDRQTYLRDLFPGGFIASSAGVFAAYAAAANHADDPTRPQYRMREFLDVYRQSMPAFIPVQQGYMRKVFMQLGIAQLMETYPWLGEHPKAVRMVTAPLRWSVEAGTKLMRASKDLRTQLRAAFHDAADLPGFLGEKLAVDRTPALAVLKDIVGENTRLADMGRDMIVTAQRLDGRNIVNDYFVSFKDGALKDDAAPVSFKLDGQTHMIDVIMATTAVPLVFEPHLGKYVDGAPGMLGVDIVADLRAWHSHGDQMGYVCFGNLERGLGLLPIDARGPLLNEAGKLEKLMLEPGKQMAENAIRSIVGATNAHFLEVPQEFMTANGQHMRYDGTANQMDIRESETDKLLAYGQSYIEAHDAELEALARRLALHHLQRCDHDAQAQLDAAAKSKTRRLFGLRAVA